MFRQDFTGLHSGYRLWCYTTLHSIKRNHLFSTITLASLGQFQAIIFAPVLRGMNTPQYRVICLLNCLMSLTVTRHKSRQFNFSSHARINHIEFEDKFLIKTHFLTEDCSKNFLTNWGINEWNTERLSVKVWYNRFNRTHCRKRSHSKRLAVLRHF